MSLRLRAGDGSLAAWSPPSPPRVRLLVEAERPAARVRAVSAAVRGTLAYLGYEPIDSPAESADLRLLVGPSPEEAEGFAARGFTDADFHYFCLKTHFRKPLSFSWEG